MKEIYEYIDYRQFLRDYMAEQKAQGTGLTQRTLLQKMGISSSGFMANVLSGKNNLTIEQVKRLASILHLDKNATDYFKYMVYFAKAKAVDEKDDFFETLQTLRRKKLKALDKKQLSLFEKWYYVVIRELLNFCLFKDDYKALANRVKPGIAPAQAQEAIEHLENLGLIQKDRHGYYRQVDQLVSTGDEVNSFLVSKFQLSMMDLGKEALEKIPQEERDISGVTVTLSDSTFQKIKSEIQNFRKRILGVAEKEERPQQVFRCNFQFFPVTEKDEA